MNPIIRFRPGLNPAQAGYPGLAPRQEKGEVTCPLAPYHRFGSPGCKVN